MPPICPRGGRTAPSGAGGWVTAQNARRALAGLLLTAVATSAGSPPAFAQSAVLSNGAPAAELISSVAWQAADNDTTRSATRGSGEHQPAMRAAVLISPFQAQKRTVHRQAQIQRIASESDLNRVKRRLLDLVAEVEAMPDDDLAAGRLDEIQEQLRLIRVEEGGFHLDEWRMLSNALSRKRDALNRASTRRYLAERQREFNTRLAEALRQHRSDVAALGFPQDYLDATIVTEDPTFGNKRWMTLRQWLSLLFQTGRYNIEGRELLVVDAKGVSVKARGARAASFYFEKEADELFISYAGEGDTAAWLLPHQRSEVASVLQELIQ